MSDEASASVSVSADVAQAANRKWWDSAVPVHLASSFYDVEGWLAEGRGPKAREVAVLGDVAGLDLIHLQCHFGKDTLSWARAGATVTGLDFSEPPSMPPGTWPGGQVWPTGPTSSAPLWLRQVAHSVNDYSMWSM